MRTQVFSICKKSTLAAAVATAVLLTACGGGGGGGGGDETPVGVTPGTGASTIVTTATPDTYTPGSPKKAVFDLLNNERSTCGFGLLAQNTQLDQAAQAHANWLVANPTLFGHGETAGTTGFTGATPADRAQAAGYTGPYVGEATSGGGPGGSLDQARGLLSAPYHALGLMETVRDVGIGIAENSFVGALNIDMGYTTARPAQMLGNSDVATYPCAGTTGTKYQLRGETPSPVPSRDLASSPVGQPVIVRVRTGNTLAITSASMTHVATGAAVVLRPTSTLANDPNPSYMAAHRAYILPDAPLLPLASYQVSLAGTNNGVAFSRTFTFTTGSAP